MTSLNRILLIRAGISQRKLIDHPLHNPPPLSLKYTKTLLETQGSPEIKIIDCLVNAYSSEDIINLIKDQDYHLMVIEISSPAFKQALSLCKKIKKNQNIFIVAVGSDVSERYKNYLSLNSTFDFILRGEYEFEIFNLIKELNSDRKNEEIKKYYHTEKSKKNFIIEDLTCLPHLQWSPKELDRYPYRYPLRMSREIKPGYVSASRGCKHGCTFCSPSVRKSYGKKLRLQTAARIANEMEHLCQLGVNLISFEDDDLTGSRNHVLSICDEINRRNLKVNWTCHARIDEVNEELLKKMKKAGCILILFGVESGSKKIITTLHKMPSHHNWNKQAKETFYYARKIGIATCAMFLVGNPSEREEDVQASIELSYHLKPDFIKVHNFTLYPGAIDYKKYHNKKEDFTSHHHYQAPTLNVSAMEDSLLKTIQIKFYKKFLFRPSFLLTHFYKYLFFYLYNYKWSFQIIKEVLFFLFLSTPLNTKEIDKKISRREGQ